MYKKDALREYILNSELRIFSNSIKVRLSKELANKYDAGHYTNHLINLQKCFNMIKTLNIQYPGNADPVLYVYVVPDNSYAELLKFPSIFDNGSGGGKAVRCYDLDGFNAAYGLSQNILENRPDGDMSIEQTKNEIHELSHIIHNQFFQKNRSICEGVAETLPLYALEFEEMFDEYRNLIVGLDESQIFSAQQLLNSEKDKTYGVETILPNRSCSFRLSYISSYLLVRGCVEIISNKYNLSKSKAIQQFLEIVRQSDYWDEYLIYDIANAIGIPQDELLNEKQIQMRVLCLLKSVHPKSALPN